MNVAPTDWRSCGDLQSLVDASTATALARSAGLPVVSLRPDYLRLKVGESALVGYAATVDGHDTPVPLHVRTFADVERARLLHQKWTEKRRDDSLMSPPEAISPSGCSVFFAFPNDNDLDGLRRVSVPRGWRRLLPLLPRFEGRTIDQHRSTVVPVRYKPGRRLVGRVSLVDDEHLPFIDGFFRWFADDRATAIARLSSVAHAAGLPVPSPIDVSTDGRLMIEAPLIGVDGSVAVADDAIDVEAFTRSLRLFHQLQVDDAPMAPRRPVAEALAALDLLALVEPTLAAAAMQLTLHLRSVDEPAGRPALVHGDLHLGQLVVHRGIAQLVDLERAHHGHSHTDLSSLAAHLLELELGDHGHRAGRMLGDLRRAWVADGGDGDDLGGVPLACALIQRALLAFRTFDPRWPGLGAPLLERAIDAAGAPRWHTVHARPTGHWTASGGDDQHTPRAAIAEGVHWAEVDPAADERLPGLATALSRGTLVAHRPGRRAVVRTGESFIKVLPPKRAAALVDRLSVVRPLLPHTLRSPQVQSVDAALGLVEIESMSGTPFHDVLIGRDPGAREAAIELAGRLVADFGKVDLTAVTLPPSGDGGDTRAWATTIAGLHPSLGVAHAPVVDRLEHLRAQHLTERPIGLVHGDLHDRNLLLGHRSGAIIDLDSVGLGDPAVDVGNLAAHLVLRAMQRGDRPTAGRSEAEQLLDAAGGTMAHRVHLARTLHRLSCVYRLRARWAHLSNDLLAASADWAESLD